MPHRRFLRQAGERGRAGENGAALLTIIGSFYYYCTSMNLHRSRETKAKPLGGDLSNTCYYFMPFTFLACRFGILCILLPRSVSMVEKKSGFR